MFSTVDMLAHKKILNCSPPQCFDHYITWLCPVPLSLVESLLSTMRDVTGHFFTVHEPLAAYHSIHQPARSADYFFFTVLLRNISSYSWMFGSGSQRGRCRRNTNSAIVVFPQRQLTSNRLLPTGGLAYGMPRNSSTVVVCTANKHYQMSHKQRDN